MCPSLLRGRIPSVAASIPSFFLRNSTILLCLKLQVEAMMLNFFRMHPAIKQLSSHLNTTINSCLINAASRNIETEMNSTQSQLR
jgi:hypothetical protein